MSFSEFLANFAAGFILIFSSMLIFDETNAPVLTCSAGIALVLWALLTSAALGFYTAYLYHRLRPNSE